MANSAINGDFSGLLKEIYTKEGIINLKPACKILTDMVPFEAGAERVGNFYHQPVKVTTENGRSFSAPGVIMAIPTTSTFQTQDAQIAPYQAAIVSTLDYESHFRAFQEGPAAFASATKLQMETMAESAVMTTEIQMLYGQDYLGLVSSTATSGSNLVLSITSGEWAPGIWAGSEGMQLDFWEGTSTKANSNANLVVVATDPVNHTVTVSGNATDLSAIATYVSSNPSLGGVVFAGTGSSSLGDQEMAGLKKIFSNKGTLFNINAANYALWQSQIIANGSTALTFAGLQNAVAQLVGRGLNEDVEVFINPRTWSNLLTDQASLRMYDSSYSDAEVEVGSKKITFHSQNGALNVYSHIFVKEGDAFIVPVKRLRRVGSTDWTFGIPGTLDGEVFIQNPTSMSYSYRMYTGQSIFCETPAKAAYISGIVNN